MVFIIPRVEPNMGADSGVSGSILLHRECFLLDVDSGGLENAAREGPLRGALIFLHALERVPNFIVHLILEPMSSKWAASFSPALNRIPFLDLRSGEATRQI